MADEDKTWELADELDIPLRKPIKVGEVSYDAIRLTEPTAGQVEDIAKDHPEAGSSVYAVHLVSGMPLAAVRKIPAREFNRARDYILAFL